MKIKTNKFHSLNKLINFYCEIIVFLLFVEIVDSNKVAI